MWGVPRIGASPEGLTASPRLALLNVHSRCQLSQIKARITLASTKTKKISVEVIAPLTGRLAQQIKTLIDRHGSRTF